MLRRRATDPRTIVLIPACNEEDRIGAVVRDVRRELPDARVVVIDDGSQDRTGEVARAAGAIVLRHPFNLGYGTALQTGYHFAHQEEADRVVQLDGDGQHVASSIRSLLEPLALEAQAAGADVVLGSRFIGTCPRTSRLRRLGSRAFATVVTWWTGQRITDPTSGFQALNRRALDQLTLDHFPEDYPDADVLIYLSRCGLRLAEVPVEMRERIGGVSMHRGTRILFYLYKMALSLCLIRVRRTSPFRAGRALAKQRREAFEREARGVGDGNRHDGESRRA